MPHLVNNNAFTPGTKVTTANTADQVIATYTVPKDKRFFLSLVEANVRLTTFATTATNFGTVSLMVNGAKIATCMCAGPGILNSPIYLEMPDPLPFQGGDVVKIVCTPSAATSFTWEGNIIGFEKP